MNWKFLNWKFLNCDFMNFWIVSCLCKTFRDWSPWNFYWLNKVLRSNGMVVKLSLKRSISVLQMHFLLWPFVGKPDNHAIDIVNPWKFDQEQFTNHKFTESQLNNLPIFILKIWTSNFKIQNSKFKLYFCIIPMKVRLKCWGGMDATQVLSLQYSVFGLLSLLYKNSHYFISVHRNACLHWW